MYNNQSGWHDPIKMCVHVHSVCALLAHTEKKFQIVYQDVKRFSWE